MRLALTTPPTIVRACGVPPPAVTCATMAFFARRRAVVVIAHPDDEVMFFAPTLLELVSVGDCVHVLCLSR